MRNYYSEIDKELKRMENFTRPDKGISWCCDRIAWCWKFRHITREQMESLCDRATAMLEIYGHELYERVY